MNGIHEVRGSIPLISTRPDGPRCGPFDFSGCAVVVGRNPEPAWRVGQFLRPPPPGPAGPTRPDLISSSALRLGEIFLADGLIGPDDLDAALAEQRASGTRLGSILYLRGRVTADAVARALARQHGVPAALLRHLEGRDPTLTAHLPADLARRFGALPVALSKAGGDLSLVVCLRDPADDQARAAVAGVVAMPTVIAVACEAVLAGHIAAAYPDDDGIDVVFDDASGPVALPVPDGGLGGLDLCALTLVNLDDQRVARDPTQSGTFPTATAPPRAATQPPVRAATEPSAPPSALPAVLDCEAAVAAIAAAQSRDAVSDAAIAFLRGAYHAAALLVVRDGVALGHRGFGGSLTPATVDSILIPLQQPSILRTVHDTGRAFVGEPPEAGTVQDRFLRLFGSPREVVVEPVVIKERVACLAFASEPRRNADDALGDLEAVVAAMEEAYLRLIRDAKKTQPGAMPPSGATSGGP